MYPRSLEKPSDSFFLFGPRSTGKTTWLRQTLAGAIWFDLLLDRDFLQLSAEPDGLIRAVEAVKPGGWVVIDEVQKIPRLLNSVHALLTKHGGKYRYALSGSSARKLKRLDSNLLAGRVLQRSFFPLTATELGGDFALGRAIDVGLLPLVWTRPDSAEDRLLAYVNTYLKEEIQQEALVGDVASFSRFLRVAALLNGQCINASNVARDAGVSRKVVERYFSILVDTLIAFWLPAWQPKATVKEVAKPKFYLFDCGVVRACSNRIGLAPAPEEKGMLLETYILHELRAYLNASTTRGELSYWRSGSGNEVDFIWSWGDKHVGIEVKSSTSWKRSFGKGLRALRDKGKIHAAHGIFNGSRAEISEGIRVWPVADFICELNAGSILTA